MIEGKYPYPFDSKVLENRDIKTGRQRSEQFGRWSFVKEEQDDEASDDEFDFKIKIEPDALVFVDGENGVIKLSLTDDGDELIITGGIYNPQKGNETIVALLDILKYIAKKTRKKVKYRTTRVNNTSHLTNKLTSFGFSPESGEFVVSIEPSSDSDHEYNELDEELERLGFLKTG